MTQTFSQLKKSKSKMLEKLNEELQKTNSKYENTDEGKYWQPGVDKAGNGYAVIRFLPAPKDEDLPFVRIWNHGFQGPGGWYIENSLTTLGKDDPVAKFNTTLWNSGIESDKEKARKQKRRLQYVSNIYVIKDSANPDNEGKVFLFRYGKKIFDKLNEAMNPQFEDEKPVNPFDFWEGANFKLKIRNVEGYRNYDKSEFETPSPLFEDDEKMEKVWEKQYSLKELIDPKNFKSYEELEAKLHKVLGIDGSTKSTNVGRAEEIEIEEDEESAPTIPSKREPTIPSEDEDDDSLEFFRKLAEED